MKTITQFLLQFLAAWAEHTLASPALGHLGYFGLGKEAAWGTAVAATDYIEILSENVISTMDRFPTRNIYNGFYEADDSVGLRRNAGTVVHAAHPVSVGHLLKAAFSNTSISVVQSGTLWQLHAMTPRSEHAVGEPRTPYTLEINRNVTSSHRYSGAMVSKLTLSLQPNQDLRVTADWITKARTLIAPSAPTFPGSPVEPFTFDTASVQLAGAGTVLMEAFQMTIDNRLEGIPALNGTNEIAKIRGMESQLINISGTLDFLNQNEELDFINQTERALILTVTKAASFHMHIEVPRFVYTAYPVAMAGRPRVTVNFEGKARYLASSLTSARITLTTIKSNY